MSKKTKMKLMPNLRFPEFRNRGDWELIKLSELLCETKQRNRDLKYDHKNVLSVSGEHGCVNQIEFLGRSYAGVSVRDYHVVEKGDIVYTKSPLKKNPYGIIKENKGKPGIVSTLYAVYRVTSKAYPTYLDYYFSSEYILNSYLQPIVRKGAKNDMKVNNFAVLGGNVAAPEIPEQQKIADCLSSLDELITAETQKLEALQQHKKGLMQQLFPAEGERVPKLRLTKKNGKPWTTIPFNKAFTRLTTRNTENNQNVLTISAKDGLVSQLDYFNRAVAARDVSGYYLLNKGDFAYNKSYSNGYPMGAIKALNRYDKGVVSTLYICFRVNQGFNLSFFEQYFDAGMHNNEIGRIAQEGARNHGLLNVGVDDFFNLSILIPNDSIEQQKIADCLSSINDLITKQEDRVESIKTHKKGLMQQLFPATSEMEA